MIYEINKCNHVQEESQLKFSEVYAVNIEVNGLKNLLKNEEQSFY